MLLVTYAFYSVVDYNHQNSFFARSNGMSMAMKAMVATVTDEEFAAIADYLANVK